MISLHYQRVACMLCVLLFVTLLAAEPAFALDKVNNFTNNLIVLLHASSIFAATVSITWTGYKFLFKHADMTEIIKILAGCLLISCAGELACFLLG